MWRELIEQLDPTAEFQEPATPEQISAAEQSLGVSFPDELVAVLRETNGVMDEYGAGVIWSCEKIASENHMFRKNQDFAELYMPFDPLLFIGDHGDGDQFAYPIQRGAIRRPLDIFIWDHESDSRTAWAFTMKQYLQRALTGEDDEPDWDNM